MAKTAVEKNQAAESMKAEGKLKVLKIQRTCVHDGPGIRTTVFFQGCGLRCLWCQNPEGLEFDGKAAVEYTVPELLKVIEKDKQYYFSTGGGVTISGGEPMLQKSEALIEFLKALKKDEINVAAETTLYAPWENIERAAPYIDLFYVDLKAVDDEELHKRCTGRESSLIRENLEKLLKLGKEITFRMVMVPGHNDGAGAIEKAAIFLKKIGFYSIELLKYHSMYVDKAKRFGIEIPDLKISPAEAEESVRRGLKLFIDNGINAYNIDIEEKEYQTEFPERVLKVQNDIREAPRALCIEVSKLKTQYYKKNGFDKPVHIHRAERLAYVLKNKSVKVYPQELLVGNFTSKRVAGQVWEEQYGILDIVFLYKINRQTPVSFQCSFKERWYFYLKIFPFWLKHSLLTKVNTKFADFRAMIARSSEMIAGFNNNMAAIAHFIVNFERLLTLGTDGIIAEIEKKRAEKPKNNQDFYDGAIIALKALGEFGQKYSEALTELAKTETDEARKAELLEMAEICANVPKNPARTYHEALQSMLFLQIALCTEAYENAVSFGRVDQILYPYYKRDLDAGRITYEKARELLCLFVLKIDEIILVNDGDSYLNVSKLFETLSVDQALTFGGVDKNGNDATNDLTYMLIDACELQPLAINMVARIHKNSPKKYLDRLAEIYIHGCPMPELFSDDIYIPSLMRHYDTTLEHARNYAIVGCVEPNASDDHFGNTDCANMNLALPLLQAMKGHEHDLWNYSRKEQWEKIHTKLINYTFKGDGKLSKKIVAARAKQIKKRQAKRGYFDYNPPETMDELLSRFQTRLNHLAKGVLTDHQKIEAALRKDFTTPLASSLYPNCVETGVDLYEGGACFNTSGIQAVGITDVADSFHALNEVVFKNREYTMRDIIEAVDANFEGEKNQKIRERLLSVPKFGDDVSDEPSYWVTETMRMYNEALASVPNCPRNGRYMAGYYALNVSDRYGRVTQALPSGRLAGVPLANSVAPHYGMEQNDLISALNAISKVNLTDYAPNGTTVTFTIDSALFPGDSGKNNLSSIFKTFLTSGGMQFQPNIINKKILIDAYNNPEKYKYLMVRVAGYCAYFNELSDDLKRIIIERTCYS
jgi:formate C-acetyltransferase